MKVGDDSAAYAANWRSVLAVDAGVGLIGVLGGLAVLAFIHVVIGALLAAAGATYVVLVVRRARQWSELRSEAGL